MDTSRGALRRPGWSAIARGAALGAVVALLALSSLAVCGYRFGTDDQAQYLVHLIELAHPGTFEGDPYIGSFGALGSFFWHAVAPLGTGPVLPAAVLGITLLITALNAVLLGAIGRSLLAPTMRAGGPWALGIASLAPALMFVVPKEQNWFGLVSLADAELTATLGVLPLVFGSLLAWVRHRVLVSLVVAALAVPIHAQTGAFLLCAWFAGAVALGATDRSLRPLAVGVGIAGLGGLGLALRASALPAEATAQVGHLGAQMYEPLMDPLAAPVVSWGGMLAIITLGAIALADDRRWRSGPAPRLLAIWCGASLVFPLATLLLHAAGTEHPLLWRLMTGRSLMLPQIGALIGVSLWSVRRMHEGGAGWATGAGVLLSVALWPFPEMRAEGAALGLGAVGITMLARAMRRPAPPLPPWWGLGAWRAPAGVLLTSAVLFIVGGHRLADRAGGWLERAEDASWIEVQRWAEANTPPGTRFVTPPYRTGWRIGSHRPTFGELRDGGLFFYSGEESVAWASRMRALGMDRMCFVVCAEEVPEMRRAYHAALRDDRASIIAQSGAAYVITETGSGAVAGEVTWSNGRFVVWWVPAE